MLDRVKPEVLQALRETGYELFVTEHTFELEHRKRLDVGYARLKQEKIPFVVRPSRLTWVEKYKYKEDGQNREIETVEAIRQIVPFASNPKKAWNQCKFSDCTTLIGDQLYRCAYLLSSHRMIHEGLLDAGLWKDALTYSPLTLQSTPEEIFKHLRHQEMPACAICPHKKSIIPARQLPVQSRVNEV